VTDISYKSFQFKKRVHGILFQNYRIFLFATLFLLAFSIGFVVLSKTYCDVITSGIDSTIYNTISITLDIFSILILYPLFLGYISLCAKIAFGKAAELSELLRFYSSKKELLSCLTFLFRMVPHFILRVLLPLTASFSLSYIIPYISKLFADAGISIAGELLYNFVFIFELAFIALAYYLAGGLILRTVDFCTGTHHKYTSYEKSSFTVLRIAVLPMYLLSVITFGILFVMYTIPYTFIGYSLFSKDRANEAAMFSRTKEFDNIGDTAVFDSTKPKNEI